MDILLNGLFFKCFFCKTLNKITHRDTVSPEHKNNINSISDFSQEIREVDKLFNKNLMNETPVKSLFMNQNVINPEICRELSNLINKSPINQNLIRNFNNLGEVNTNFNQSQSLLLTPKNYSKFSNNLHFSPDEKFQTPITPRNQNSSNFLLLITSQSYH